MRKAYPLKKAVIVSLISSILAVAAIYGVSLTLGRFHAILLPDTGADWYYWKLPNAELWATVTAWTLYVLHQLSVWYLLFKLKKEPMAAKGTVGSINIWLLAVNGFFIMLHLLQTALFYDGLAQQVPVFSSQGSVIGMLVLVLILMNSRRGLFFGKKVRLPGKGVAAVTNIHGIYISWAIIYTFWFHPTEGTIGHLLGFFFFFLLMIQMSLAKTSWHFNIKWITLLEVFVAFHGAIVAIESGNNMWPMFFFGFMMMFIVTQMFGILKNRIAIAGVFISYALLVILTYTGVFGPGHPIYMIHQIAWIPIILYGLVFVVVYALQLLMVIIGKLKKNDINTPALK